MAASKFKARTKRIPLGFLGEAWATADAYLETRYLTIDDSRKITSRIKQSGNDDDQAIEEMLAVVKELFTAGQTLDSEGALVELSAEDIELAFDAEAILGIYVRAMGNPDSKAPATSTTTTPAEAQNQPGA